MGRMITARRGAPSRFEKPCQLNLRWEQDERDLLMALAAILNLPPGKILGPLVAREAHRLGVTVEGVE